MRPTLFRMALLAAVAATPALAQTSPASPDRDRPAAATEGSTRPGMSVQPPAANAGQGVQSRVDSMRPDSPTQGMTAGQGTALSPATSGMSGTTAPGTAPGMTTGTTTGGRGSEGGQSAVQIDSGTRMGPLEAGANSFTEGQARSRIEAAGFSNLEGLQKDDSGIWRGRAMRGGQQVEVGLDYRGNVAPMTR
jgi:hypothetical protein